MHKRDTIGVIGLGIMGSAMAGNMVAGGFDVLGYDVLPRRRAALGKTGGRAARSARDVAKGASIVVTSLPSAQALSEVAAELAGAAARGMIVVETSTLPIAVKEEARVALAKGGVTLLDCPLSGTGAQAKVRDLVVYASGARDAYRKCVPVLEAF